MANESDPIHPADDIASALARLMAEVAKVGEELKAAEGDPLGRGLAAIQRLSSLSLEVEAVKQASAQRAAAQLDYLRKTLAEVITRQPTIPEGVEQATLTIGLSDTISPATFAEILVALDTLHRDLAGLPLRDLVAKIGDTEEVRSDEPANTSRAR